jgi:hypothetical protein
MMSQVYLLCMRKFWALIAVEADTESRGMFELSETTVPATSTWRKTKEKTR